MKIIITGAGHGGLTAGYNLAKNGHDVTVYEKQKKEDLGFDWVDSMFRDSFEKSGVPAPSDDAFIDFTDIAYTNPKKTVKFAPVHRAKAKLCYMERKMLLAHLVKCCEEVGVKFVFEAEVVSAIAEFDCVKGILAKIDGKFTTISADLVVDAGGMNSPVKKSLPSSMGIEKHFAKNDTFFVYRAYYKTKTELFADPHYTCYFFHKNRCGMDWVITEGDYVDVLVGGFGNLTEEEKYESVSDFLEEYPDVTDEIVRGGSMERIPLRKNIAIFVANGYAAVGNSAGMTEPMSGSGLTLSMKAGKFLADAVNEGKKADISTLWNYEYKYFEECGKKQLMNHIIKGLLSEISAEDIDYLMETGIMGEKEIAGSDEPYSVDELLNKGKNLLKRPKLLTLFAALPKKAAAMMVAQNTIPEKYDRLKVDAWAKIYNEI